MVPETPPVILFGLGHIFALPQVNSSQLSSFRSGSGVPLSSGSGRSSQATESASNLVQADFPLSIEVSAICIFGGGFRNRAKNERKRSVAIVISVPGCSVLWNAQTCRMHSYRRRCCTQAANACQAAVFPIGTRVCSTNMSNAPAHSVARWMRRVDHRS